MKGQFCSGTRICDRNTVTIAFAILLVLITGINNSINAAAPEVPVVDAQVSSRAVNGGVSDLGGRGDTRAQNQKEQAINGHILKNSYDIIKNSDRPREKYQRLHEERLWAVAVLSRERSHLDELARRPRQRPIQVPILSDSAYEARVNDIDTKIRLYEARQNNGDLKEAERAEAHALLLDLTRQKARAALELVASQQYIREKQEYEEATSKEEASKLAVIEVTEYLSRLDGAIGTLLQSTDSENSYRLYMGFGFVILIVILILCFFVVGTKAGSIGEMFANDRGLQFLTLFSLVITITMFGLLNILEGKELSALLGGLSGYILGRVNLGEGSKEKAAKS